MSNLEFELKDRNYKIKDLSDKFYISSITGLSSINLEGNPFFLK